MDQTAKAAEPAIGIPYHPGYHAAPPEQQYYARENPYQAGMIPPHAIFGDPKGAPIQQTIYRDTPAPFNCHFCGDTGLTAIEAKPSLAAYVGCMVPFFCGFCFLFPAMNCLWHKYHYCPSCKEKVGDYEKNDPCLVMDPPHWQQTSFALPG